MSSEKILDQAEIDALIHGVDTGAVSTESVPGPNEVRNYDFNNQMRIVRGRMPTLEMINERFARAMRLSLFSMIRRTPEISTSAIETPKFADYLPTLQVPTSLNHVRVSPLSGVALIIFEPRVIFSIIDCYFGVYDFDLPHGKVIHDYLQEDEIWESIEKGSLAAA